MHVIVFEDHHVDQLHPITLSRPAFAMLCGSYRLIDWIRGVGGSRQAVVRDHIQEIQLADFPCLSEYDGTPSEKGTLFVNARLVPSHSTFSHLDHWIKQPRPGIVRTASAIAAAMITEPPQPLPDTASMESVEQFLSSPQAAELPVLDLPLELIDYPHDIIRSSHRVLGENLSARLATESYQEIADGVFAADGVELGSYVVTDTKAGPIILEAEAKVGPYAMLSGPVHIGARTRVIEHAAIKDGVSIGHTAKIGGEVEASVIESYTNKQHHGFLGHSYLGSWINLGAGTCNSDLKNTYGEVKMEYRGKKTPTNMQFVGCIVGDYSKTAINTGIFTGKTIGVCSMIYGFVTTNVPSFVNYARLFGQVSELPSDIMIATQRRMFQRRNVPQRECDEQLIRDMYELTRDERRLVAEPLPL